MQANKRSSGLWAKVLVGGCVLVLAVLAAVFFTDESLSEDAKRFAAPIPEDTRADNGYVHLAGFDAPPGTDAVAYGREWIETFRNARTQAEVKAGMARFPEPASAGPGDKETLCAPARSPCLPRAAAEANAWRASITDAAVPMERLEAMYATGRFDESCVPSRADTPLPRYSTRLRASQLVLSRITLDAQEGRVDAALVQLERKIAFDRRMLAGSRTLIGGMVAASWLRNDYALLGEIVHAHGAALAPHRERVLAMTAPLTTDEVRAVSLRMLAGEAHLVTGLMGTLEEMPQTEDAKSGWTQRVFFKLGLRPNATSNLLAARFAQIEARVKAFDPAHVDAFRATLEADAKEHGDPLSDVRTVYNPVGKVLASIAAPDYAGYVLRVSDVAAMSRAARVQVLAALEPAADPAAVLARDAALFDPYTGAPFAWDAATRRFGFALRGKVSRDTLARHELAL